MRLNAVMRGMRVGVLVLAGLSTGASQTLSTLFNFNHTASGVVGEGSPVGSVIVGPDDNFYGMGYGGSVYSIGPAGAFTNLHAATPYVTAYAGLALGPDGALYGADSQGVFRVTLSGDLVVINGDQTGSQGGLTVGGDGNFYATDAAGGAAGLGSVFKISQTGALTTLYSFRGAAGIDGSTPQSPLVLGPDGNFYGTTSNAGDGGCCGTVFRITPGGALTTLHFFNGNDGASPIGGLVLGSDGNFYGTTATGLYGSPASNGTVFKITSRGVFSGLHMFNGADGKQPSAALTLGPDGNLYGTTRAGGANSLGTVFRINQGGTLTTVYSFSGTDGATPLAALTLGRDGNLYGTTQQDGANGDGTFFVLGFGSSSLSINSNGIVSAASYNSPVAPGSIAAVFGSFPISVPLSATTTPTAGTLGGLSTYFGNVPPAPLFYASQSQLNVQIPWELEGLSQTTVTVGQSGETSATRTVPIAAYAPGIFVLNTQTNQAAVTDLNNNLISPDNPASPGAYIQIYCTGLGPVTNQPLTGTAALSSPLSWTTITPLVSVGDKTAVVVFSGLVPGEIGLYQVNVQLPSDAPTGSAIPIGISIEGVQSNSVNITVKE